MALTFTSWSDWNTRYTGMVLRPRAWVSILIRIGGKPSYPWALVWLWILNALDELAMAAGLRILAWVCLRGSGLLGEDGCDSRVRGLK
jgi:hypothetical protein